MSQWLVMLLEDTCQRCWLTSSGRNAMLAARAANVLSSDCSRGFLVDYANSDRFLGMEKLRSTQSQTVLMDTDFESGGVWGY